MVADKKLKIILSKGKSGQESKAGEGVSVACPDHLVLAKLPVARTIGSVPPPAAALRIKNVGRAVERRAGEKVLFCLRCNFPIAIYGRLSPCEHAFCLDCAKSGPNCFICEERIQKIQSVKRADGFYICANQSCFKSFLERDAFKAHLESHIIENNATRDSGVHDLGSSSIVQSPASAPVGTPMKMVGLERRSPLGLPPRPPTALSFSESYSQPWNAGPVYVQGVGRDPAVTPSNLPPHYPTQGMGSVNPESSRNQVGMDTVAFQSMHLQPPPTLPAPIRPVFVWQKKHDDAGNGK